MRIPTVAVSRAGISSYLGVVFFLSFLESCYFLFSGMVFFQLWLRFCPVFKLLAEASHVRFQQAYRLDLMCRNLSFLVRGAIRFFTNQKQPQLLTFFSTRDILDTRVDASWPLLVMCESATPASRRLPAFQLALKPRARGKSSVLTAVLSSLSPLSFTRS